MAPMPLLNSFGRVVHVSSVRWWAALLMLVCSLLPRTASAQATPSAPADRFVTVNGIRLHYLDWGNPDRPPLVLVHGIGRVAHTFDIVAPSFTSQFHVLAVDMRGHGDSAWDPAANYLVEDHARDFEAFVTTLGLNRLTLWGNSTGGRVVQVYAGLHPENVRALRRRASSKPSGGSMSAALRARRSMCLAAEAPSFPSTRNSDCRRPFQAFRS